MAKSNVSSSWQKTPSSVKGLIFILSAVLVLGILVGSFLVIPKSGALAGKAVSFFCQNVNPCEDNDASCNAAWDDYKGTVDKMVDAVKSLDGAQTAGAMNK